MPETSPALASGFNCISDSLQAANRSGMLCPCSALNSLTPAQKWPLFKKLFSREWDLGPALQPLSTRWWWVCLAVLAADYRQESWEEEFKRHPGTHLKRKHADPILLTSWGWRLTSLCFTNFSPGSIWSQLGGWLVSTASSFTNLFFSEDINRSDKHVKWMLKWKALYYFMFQSKSTLSDVYKPHTEKWIFQVFGSSFEIIFLYWMSNLDAYS